MLHLFGLDRPERCKNLLFEFVVVLLLLFILILLLSLVLQNVLEKRVELQSNFSNDFTRDTSPFVQRFWLNLEREKRNRVVLLLLVVSRSECCQLIDIAAIDTSVNKMIVVSVHSCFFVEPDLALVTSDIGIGISKDSNQQVHQDDSHNKLVGKPYEPNSVNHTLCVVGRIIGI